MYDLFTASFAVIMQWIHQKADWPDFTWNREALAQTLPEIRHRQGRLIGRMASLGFALRNEASLNTLTENIVQSSAIEGERLDTQEVRSSIALRLGIDIGGVATIGRNVEGVVLKRLTPHGSKLK